MSRLLNTGLDRETLSVCLSLTEQGINPEAVAAVLKEARKDGKIWKVRLTLYGCCFECEVAGGSREC
jgi:mitotic-spindle organizing protein 1